MGAVVGIAHAYTRAEFMEAARRRWQDQFGAESGETGNAFFAQIYDDALSDDLDRVSADDLATLTVEFWAYGERRVGDDILVRMRTATCAGGVDLGRDVLEIIGNDRPFIVDSVMGEIGAQVRSLIHISEPTSPY